MPKKTITIYQKIWKNSKTTLVITIPKWAQEQTKTKEGDTIKAIIVKNN